MAVTLIPQALAFSVIALLPPIHGLYTALYPLLVYVFMGTSKHVCVGPFSVISLLIGDAINSYLVSKYGENYKIVSEPDGINPTTSSVINVAGVLALEAGIVQIVFGILQLGFVKNFLSIPVITSFTSASGCIIFTSQLFTFFGLNLPSEQYIWNTWIQVGGFTTMYINAK